MLDGDPTRHLQIYCWPCSGSIQLQEWHFIWYLWRHGHLTGEIAYFLLWRVQCLFKSLFIFTTKTLRLALSVIKPHILLAARLRNDMETFSTLLAFLGGEHTGPRFNIKISSYQYRKSYCGDKTVVRSSYLHNGISYSGKMASLYWFSPLIVGVFSNKRQVIRISDVLSL